MAVFEFWALSARLGDKNLTSVLLSHLHKLRRAMLFCARFTDEQPEAQSTEATCLQSRPWD